MRRTRTSPLRSSSRWRSSSRGGATSRYQPDKGFARLDALAPLHQGKKLNILAVSGQPRSEFVKDVPTLTESGINLAATGWNTFFAPKSMPAAKVKNLAHAVATVMADPAVRKRFVDASLEPVSMTQEQTIATLKAYHAQWEPVVKRSGYQRSAHAARRMIRNILFVMCDQLQWDYLGCSGHASIRTPNIDALAGRGVRFSRAYAQSTICGSSRMSFYTGRYVASHGAAWNNFPLKVGELTLGDYLRPLGRRTVLVGKTHMAADVEGMARLGIDLAPTFVEACGGARQPHRLEGLALQPWLHGEPPARWRAFANSEYDYSATSAAGALGVAPMDARMFMVADARWKYVHAPGFRPMLFDLAADPGELRDLGGDPAYHDPCERMHEALARWGLRQAQRTTLSDEQILAMRGASQRKGILLGFWDETELPEDLVHDKWRGARERASNPASALPLQRRK